MAAFESVSIKNFGPIHDLEWEGLGRINLVIGPNGCGKTFLLKAMYCAIKAVEMHGRGAEPKDVAEILAEKLYWTFQVGDLGGLVAGRRGSASIEAKIAGGDLKVEFGAKATKLVKAASTVAPRLENSVFLPAKEIVSLVGVILRSREEDQTFGFDDTYLDLARALRIPTTRGRNFEAFSEGRGRLEALIGGYLDYDVDSGRWQYVWSGSPKRVHPMGVTAEGIKKVGIVDALLGNRYLRPGSIVFIDEPEANLHPTAISTFLEIVAILAKSGIQFVMASHSYFVVKKLHLLARELNLTIPLLQSTHSADSPVVWQVDDLRDGIPPNEIVEESVRLYEAEVEQAFR